MITYGRENNSAMTQILCGGTHLDDQFLEVFYFKARRVAVINVDWDFKELAVHSRLLLVLLDSQVTEPLKLPPLQLI